MNSYYDRSAPFLPLEMEREIFKTAAERLTFIQLYPETIVRLLLVSRRVHKWIARIKYKTVASSLVHALRKEISSHLKPSSFFRECVRNLYPGPQLADLNRDISSEIVLTCSGIQSLVIMVLVDSSSLIALEALIPRRLALHITCIFEHKDSGLVHSLFASVTHLDLLDTLRTLNDREFLWSKLAVLPCLTHLSVFKLDDVTVAITVLPQCRKLQLLV
ncbi:hypothetical protein C8R43DRAFT_1145501 [Mycena crocata]|nr:hypothetical protein C8R43DRAFT_1145501 [Mycena crocata]